MNQNEKPKEEELNDMIVLYVETMIQDSERKSKNDKKKKRDKYRKVSGKSGKLS